jgi:hypothetical protein
MDNQYVLLWWSGTPFVFDELDAVERGMDENIRPTLRVEAEDWIRDKTRRHVMFCVS